MLCKTCGKGLSYAKGRKSLTGVVYTTLYDLAMERAHSGSSRVHEYLSKDPAYICKCCHATVTKYANLKPCIDEISANMMSTSQNKDFCHSLSVSRQAHHLPSRSTL